MAVTGGYGDRKLKKANKEELDLKEKRNLI